MSFLMHEFTHNLAPRHMGIPENFKDFGPLFRQPPTIHAADSSDCSPVVITKSSLPIYSKRNSDISLLGQQYHIAFIKETLLTANWSFGNQNSNMSLKGSKESNGYPKISLPSSFPDSHGVLGWMPFKSAFSQIFEAICSTVESDFVVNNIFGPKTPRQPRF